MNIVRLRPHLGRDDAVRKFCAKSLKVPHAAELVYLPFVVFRYAVEMIPYAGKAKMFEGLFLADLVQGVPVNIKKGTSIEVKRAVEKEFSDLLPPSSSASSEETAAVIIESCEAEGEQVLPSALTRDEAVSRGKKLLRYDLMRLAGGLRYKKVGISVHPDMKLIYYPFWLIYYRGRRGEINLRVIDAVSGRKEGGEIVTSLKIGLVKKAKDSLKFEQARGESLN